MGSQDRKDFNGGARPEEGVSLEEKNGLHEKPPIEIQSEEQKGGPRDTSGAGLTEDKFSGTDLRDPYLRDANLTNEKGLLAEHLAGKDLCGARLPKDFKGFAEPLRFVEEASKNCRKILLIMLMVCAYSILTIVTTTDLRLISNQHSSPLPIMQSQIPIVVFYAVAPLLLLGLYV